MTKFKCILALIVSLSISFSGSPIATEAEKKQAKKEEIYQRWKVLDCFPKKFDKSKNKHDENWWQDRQHETSAAFYSTLNVNDIVNDATELAELFGHYGDQFDLAFIMSNCHILGVHHTNMKPIKGGNAVLKYERKLQLLVAKEQCRIFSESPELLARYCNLINHLQFVFCMFPDLEMAHMSSNDILKGTRDINAEDFYFHVKNFLFFAYMTSFEVPKDINDKKAFSDAIVKWYNLWDNIGVRHYKLTDDGSRWHYDVNADNGATDVKIPLSTNFKRPMKPFDTWEGYPPYRIPLLTSMYSGPKPYYKTFIDRLSEEERK